MSIIIYFLDACRLAITFRFKTISLRFSTYAEKLWFYSKNLFSFL